MESITNNRPDGSNRMREPMKMKTGITKEAGGFTLTELMITITILGLIAVLSLPAYNHFTQGWKLNGEAQQFAGTLRAARAAAVMKHIDVVFTFDPAMNRYFYFEDEDGDGNRDSTEYRSATRELPPGITIAAHTLSNETLTFGSKGNTRESGTITLSSTDSRRRTIRIYGITGNVKLD